MNIINNTKNKYNVISAFGILAVMVLGIMFIPFRTYAITTIQNSGIPKYDNVTGLLTDYGRSLRLREVNSTGYSYVRYYPPILGDTNAYNTVGSPTVTNTIAANASTIVNQVLTNPAPIIYSISPNFANSNPNGTIIKITGGNFTTNSITKWNGANRETIYISPKELTVKLTSGDVSGGLGEYLITVFNGIPGGGFSNAIVFTIGTGSPAESLTSNALSGTTGFLRLGLMVWFMFVILIILGVILWRKFYLKNKTKVEGEEEISPLEENTIKQKVA